MKNKIHFYLILTFLGACGSSSQQKDATSSGPPAPSGSISPNTSPVAPKSIPADSTPVLLVASGYQSCPDSKLSKDNYIYGMLQDQLQAVQKKFKNVKFLMSCFSSSENDLSFVSDEAPNQYVATNQQNIFQKINALVSSVNQPVVYITGHSYGGWLAMKYATMLPRSAQIRVLSTLDPISPAGCSPKTYISWGVGVLTGNLSAEVPGCNIFPQDIKLEERTAIRQRSAYWYNYYQTQYRLLHSSAIPEATQNEVRPQMAGGLKTSHDALGSEDLTRQNVLKIINQDLAK